MAPKKKGGKKKKKESNPEDDIDLNENLRANYKRALALLNLQPHPSLLKAINNDVDPAAPIVELCVDVEIGAPGLRAFCAALLARGREMKTPGYKHLKSLRLWRAGIGDAGVAAVAEVLRNGATDCPLESVEFMDCGVGPAGCAALSYALLLGGNSTLKTLRLDINPTIGDAGVAELCRGLRANRTLTKLTLSYCGLGPEAAVSLASAITAPLSALEAIDTMGNQLGSDGLLALALAARRSKVLKSLGLADNGIGGGYLVTSALAHGLPPGVVAPAGLAPSHPLLAGPMPKRTFRERVAAPEFDPVTGRLNTAAAADEPLSPVRIPGSPGPSEDGEAEEGKAGEAGEGGVEGSPDASPAPSGDEDGEGGGGDDDEGGGGGDDDDDGGGGGGDDDDDGGGGDDDGGDGDGDGGDDGAPDSPGRSGVGGLPPAPLQPPRAPAAPGAAFDVTGAAVASCQGALATLGEALLDPGCGLCMVNLEMNGLTAAEAEVLVPYLPPENAKVLVCKVDTTLPAALFKALYRNKAPAKAKGKKKKGGKKKKK